MYHLLVFWFQSHLAYNRRLTMYISVQLKSLRHPEGEKARREASPVWL